MTDRRPQQPLGQDLDAADAVTPWPGWIRYTVLAVLFAVVGIGLVTVFYDKGFLPIAGPFVLIFLLPLLLPLRRRGLGGRVRRQLASGQEALAADTVEGLNRLTADGWPRRAPVRGQVAGAARTAHTLHGVLRQLGEAGAR